MKLLFLALSFTLVSCSSNSKKMDDNSAMDSSKTTDMKKSEMKKTDGKKEMAKKMQMKKTDSANTANSKFGKTVTCSYGEVQRVLENKFSDNGGCEVLYTKDGSTSSIATAQNELDYCQSVVDKVAGNLTNAGFNCQ